MKKHAALISFIWLSAIASILNYLTYPLLARILPDAQFVNITVALSLLTQMSTFLSSIVAITVSLSKETDTKQSTTTIERLQAILMKMFLVVVLVFIAISPTLLGKLSLPLAFVLPICLLMLFSIPTSVISGFFNGKNRLVKLGYVTVLIAVFQFACTILVGFTTRNGASALNAMAVGQLLSIGAIYVLFRKEGMPSIIRPLTTKASAKTESMRSLVTYTALCSLAIMLVNILQIADLLLIKGRGSADVRLYADLYVISRVVFFAGTVFIWPFLGTVDIYRHNRNTKPLIKLFGIFGLITLSAIGGFLLFGPEITKLLFGSSYTAQQIRQIGILSIVYKLIFLALTSLTLYFIVIRSYIAVVIPFLLGAAVATYSIFAPSGASISSILNALCLLGILALGLYLALFRHAQREHNPRS